MSRIHPHALVESQEIGENTSIWAFAHIMRGARIGSDCNIGDHTFIESGAVIGNRVTIKNQVLIWEGIVIEDDVFIGPRVTFTNDRYPRSPRMQEAQDRYSRPDNWLEAVQVRRGCSLGAGAIVCPGIELGCYSLIAAGSVVTHDVPAFALMLGNPARHVSDVCVCGRPIPGNWRTESCQWCGQSGCSRLERWKQLICSLPEVESSRLPEQHGVSS